MRPPESRLQSLNFRLSEAILSPNPIKAILSPAFYSNHQRALLAPIELFGNFTGTTLKASPECSVRMAGKRRHKAFKLKETGAGKFVTF